ncbi:MAG: Spy/CpxP family protein refolding chaperone [Oceanospirillaceae bacterium]|nr:Spy/CpxP family protein refolding chaperone [Oceanospirillaceae bacterium]MCP5336027.1 Spy/CpxP family protein refolding chaperone [Oceanospirillaceae bacterium]MCP5350262.1 Spy/CpxP family protein refolding chaperone [Oceanospirillaceae bacterium]
MKFKLRHLMLAGFVTTGLLAAAAQACPGMEGGKRDHGPDRMFKELNLTSEQQTQIDALREQMKTGSKEYHQKLRDLREKEMALIDQYDEKAARGVIAEKADVMQKLDFMRLQNMQKVNAVLTTEQREKMRSLMEKRKNKMGKDRREDDAE